jgi:hypothetical protein
LVNVPIRNPLKDLIIQNRDVIFPVLAFLIPLLVRAVPEILMGSYLVGFDTTGFYVPSTLLWPHGGITLWGFLATAPLCYSIFMSIVAAGGSLVLALKIIPSLLLGFLGLSIYAYAKRGLSWSSSKSIFVALLGTIYFVALRISWDQFREELGLIFFFLVLTLLVTGKNRSWKRYVALSLAVTAVVLSHQLIAILMFGAIISTIVINFFRKDFTRSIHLTLVSLPAALYFVIFYVSDAVRAGFLNYSTNVGSPIAAWTGFPSYQSMLASEAGFFLYCFIPLLPLVLVSLWRFKNLQLRSWVLLSLILLFIPLDVSPFWWVLLLAYPFAFYVTDAISRLKQNKWTRFKFSVRRIAVLYLVLSTAILSFGFIALPPEKPFLYFNPQPFNNYENQIPSSMLQNSISITDCQSTANVLQWFKNNLNDSAILLTHTAFYGWALLTLDKNQVSYYGFSDPVNAAMNAAQEGHTQIYLIWWINGQGWYGQPTVPLSFNEVYQSGRIAIYSYVGTG